MFFSSIRLLQASSIRISCAASHNRIITFNDYFVAAKFPECFRSLSLLFYVPPMIPFSIRHTAICGVTYVHMCFDSVWFAPSPINLNWIIWSQGRCVIPTLEAIRCSTVCQWMPHVGKWIGLLLKCKIIYQINGTIINSDDPINQSESDQLNVASERGTKNRGNPRREMSNGRKRGYEQNVAEC